MDVTFYEVPGTNCYICDYDTPDTEPGFFTKDEEHLLFRNLNDYFDTQKFENGGVEDFTLRTGNEEEAHMKFQSNLYNARSSLDFAGDILGFGGLFTGACTALFGGLVVGIPAAVGGVIYGKRLYEKYSEMTHFDYSYASYAETEVDDALVALERKVEDLGFHKKGEALYNSYSNSGLVKKLITSISGPKGEDKVVWDKLKEDLSQLRDYANELSTELQRPELEAIAKVYGNLAQEKRIGGFVDMSKL